MMGFALPERYVTMVLNPLLVGVSAIFLALSVNDLIKLHLASDLVSGQPDSATRRLQPRSISGMQPRGYYDTIVQRDIFNLTPAPVESAVTTNEDLQIKLLGTSHVSDDKPFAIVEDAGGNEALYRLGDMIPNAGRIVEIWQDRAVILHNGHRVALAIPRDETGESDTEPNVPPRARRRPLINNPMIRRPGRPQMWGRRVPAEGVHRMSPTRYVIERSTVNRNLQNMAKLLTEVRAIPNLENGASNGFRLSEIQQGSIFQEIGLHDGDVLTAIEGEHLNDPTKALPLLQSLRNRSSITLNVIRNGGPLQLNYHIH
jgi:type II secretion system protein C